MKPRWAVTLLALAGAGAVSCGLFDTRDPASPGGNQFTCFTLTAPVNVYANIAQAYGKPAGLACYVSTLADSTAPTSIGFRFHPDPADSISFPSQFASWSKGIEERVAENITNDSDTTKYSLTFDPNFVSITSQPDLEIRRYPYQIRFKGTAIPDTFFQGLAEISVVRGTGGVWQVTDWVDRRDPGGTTTLTWGYLRGSYRTGF